MQWIEQKIGVKTDDNIAHLFNSYYKNLTPENIKTVIANYRNYERAATNQ